MPGPCGSSRHVFVLNSYSINLLLSLVSPIMYFPSGDQREPKIPFEPGNAEISRVLMSTSLIADFSPNGGSLVPNPSVPPSADHVASFSRSSPVVRRSGGPPSLLVRYICHVFPGGYAAKAIRFPSGDQCGSAAASGGKVSWTRSVPSTRLRQTVLSGY